MLPKSVYFGTFHLVYLAMLLNLKQNLTNTLYWLVSSDTLFYNNSAWIPNWWSSQLIHFCLITQHEFPLFLTNTLSLITQHKFPRIHVYLGHFRNIWYTFGLVFAHGLWGNYVGILPGDVFIKQLVQNLCWQAIPASKRLRKVELLVETSAQRYTEIMSYSLLENQSHIKALVYRKY